MKTLSVCTSLIAALFCATALLHSSSSTTVAQKHFLKPLDQDNLEQIIPQMMDSAGVQGLALAVIENGKLAWVKSFGVKNAETKAPVTEGTIFQAASLSKPVFAYAVLTLVEKGKLDLDKPLLDYIPVAYFEENFLKRPVDDERLRRLTARMVLSHSTGFPNWRQDEKSLKLNFDPGAHFSYSGEGFVLLQKVIEHLTGKPIQEFVNERVFTPLHMPASSYVWRESYTAEITAAHGPFGKIEERDKMMEGNAAYSMYTTAKDYGSFLAAMLNQRGLQKKTFAEMLKPQVQLPVHWGDFSGLTEGLYWGHGWGLQRTKSGDAFWHWGDNGPFKCYVVGYPQQKRGLVFFTNSATGLDLATELVRRALGEDQEAVLRWLNYDSYNSASAILAKTAQTKGMPAALVQYREQKQSNPNYQINEGAINRLGYTLMRSKRMDDALLTFQLNVENFPDSWNVYDSYAEAQLRNGNRELAVEYYQKSLDRNSNNEGARQILTALRTPQTQAGNVQFKLKGYAQAKLVALAGNFNNWNDLHTFFHKESEGWICRLNLSPGKYIYKFVIDGEWITDPNNPQTEDDGDGNVNSVLVIE